MRFMRNEGFLSPIAENYNQPYRQYIESGHFARKLTKDHDGEDYMQTMVSPKGMSLVLKRLYDKGIVDGNELIQVKESLLNMQDNVVAID